MRQSVLDKDLLKRLNIISGQALGVRKMLRAKRTKKSIFYVLLAMEGAVKETIYSVFDESIRKHLADEVNRLEEDEIILAEYAETLTCIKKKLHRYSLRELTEVCEMLEKIKTEKDNLRH